jgi:hypothetical protein
VRVSHDHKCRSRTSPDYLLTEHPEGHRDGAGIEIPGSKIKGRQDKTAAVSAGPECPAIAKKGGIL